MTVNTQTNAAAYDDVRDSIPQKSNTASPSTPREYANSMLPKLTFDEKVALLTGSDVWRTFEIPHLGISKIKMSDGPVGVRGGLFADGVTAASLPTGVSLAATWDTEAVSALAGILVSECRSKEVDVVLGPTVCLPRSPLGGRNFESYSEDPLLTGVLSATYTKVIQAAGIAVAVKHFAANDQEKMRFVVNEIISERALREIHLRPFEITVRDAKPWAIMTAYNQINGQFCSNNEYLIRKVLRGDWSWEGLLMSDWFGTNSVVPAVEAGLDLEMPGPTQRRGKWLKEAVQKALIKQDSIDSCVSRVLELVYKTGKGSGPLWQERPEVADDRPEHRDILRQYAAEGIVLLKNDGNILPLHDLSKKRIAFIGPNASRSVSTGGGSSNLQPHYRTTPFESFRTAALALYSNVTVSTAPGIHMHRYLPLVDSGCTRDPRTGLPGFELSYWANTTHDGEPVQIESRPSSQLFCYDNLPPELVAMERYAYQARTKLTPKTSGKHEFSLSTCGPAKLTLDGQVLLDIERHWWSPKSTLFMNYGSPEHRVSVDLEAGREYDLVLQSVNREPKPFAFSYTDMLERGEALDGGRIGYLEEQKTDYLGEALALAKESDIVVLVVGRDSDWETETSDMDSMDLPGQSNELISAVARANKNVIVVNQTGTPINMPWLNQVPAIVQAWYQGQEQGNSLADILLGTKNPCGKLPITFPRRIQDHPSFIHYPGENDQTWYGEGIYAGYRYFDKMDIEPLFPFGAGLSYTTFRYANMQLSASVLDLTRDGEPYIEVAVDVENTGEMDGKEIVQFYVSQISTPRLSRPVRELKGWDKVYVSVGGKSTATCRLDRISVSYWDDKPGRWVVDANAVFRVSACKDSRDPGVAAEFRVEEAYTWLH